MHCGDSIQQRGGSTVAGHMSIPLALKTLEHSELYARRKKSSGSLSTLHSMANILCEYDSLDSASLCESIDSLILPPTPPLQTDHNVSSTQFR